MSTEINELNIDELDNVSGGNDPSDPGGGGGPTPTPEEIKILATILKVIFHK